MNILQRLIFSFWRCFFWSGADKMLIFISPPTAIWLEALLLDIIETRWKYRGAVEDSHEYEVFHNWMRELADAGMFASTFGAHKNFEIFTLLADHGLLMKSGAELLKSGWMDLFTYVDDFQLIVQNAFIGAWNPEVINLRYFPSTGDRLVPLAYLSEYNENIFNDVSAQEKNMSYARERRIGDLAVVKVGKGRYHVRYECRITRVEVRVDGAKLYDAIVVRTLAKGPDATPNKVGESFRDLEQRHLWVDLWDNMPKVLEEAAGYDQFVKAK